MDIPNSTIIKRCTKCGVEYPATAKYFNRNCRSKDGFTVWCVSCRAAYRDANRERDRAKEREKYHADPDATRERNRKKYWANSEARRESTRRSNAKHREKRRAYSREHNPQYYAANAEYLREYQREYRQKHADKIAAYKTQNADVLREKARKYGRVNAEKRSTYNKLFWKANPEKRRAKEHARRARKLSAGGSFTAADIEAIRTAQGNRCYLCGDRLKKFHIDHFIPLALGGTNDAGNLRLACPTCNLSKGAKHPHEMGRLI